MAMPHSRIAERVGGRVAPLEPDLMNAVIVRLHKEFVIECDPALWRGIEFHHPASDARWIELFIPRGVERIGEIDALTVATDFNHLRAATQRFLGLGGMWCLTHHSTDMHRAGLFGMERVGNVVLQHFPCAPTRDVKKPIVYGEINIGNERRYCFEALKQRGELLGIGWLSRDPDDFLNLPCSVLAMPEPNRGAQILDRDDDTRKSICLGGVVRRAHLENHLLLLARSSA